MTTPSSPSAAIPVVEATPVLTYAPVTMSMPGRPVPLELKVSVPATGGDLPILLFSHGHGSTVFLSSLDGYGPVCNFWAAHGFVVIQPTHLDSGTLGLREADNPDAPLYGVARARDISFILDHLDDVEAAVPGLAGRLDRERVAVAGHSMGGFTVCALLGMQIDDPLSGEPVSLAEGRIGAAVAMCAPGSGHDLNEFAATNYPVLKTTDFSTMSPRALVVAGDHDQNERFSDRVSYRTDAYTLSPGPKKLLTMYDAEHQLGGVSGYDAVEATDENPERVATVRAMIWAYLRSELHPDDTAWSIAVDALERAEQPLGKVESK